MTRPYGEQVADLLTRYRFRYRNEDQLQERLAELLKQHGVGFCREYRIDAANRFDFLLPHGVVLEVKVKGSLADALRQVDRYLALPQVNCVILAGTPRWAAESLPERPDWAGKGFHMVKLERQSL